MSPRRPLLAPLLLGAAVVLFLAPYVFGGRSMVPLDLIPIFQPWARHARELWGEVPLVHNPLLDSLQQYYPRRVYMTDALHGGWLPLWNPYLYGGMSFLGLQQGAVLYPPAWLLTLFAPELQFGWSALLHLALAAAGTYLFLRRFELSRAASAAGAAAFAFNGFIVIWLAYPNVTQWTLCWLPLALYCWERGRAADDLRWITATAAVLALSLLGGHGQSSAYVLLVWGLWAFYRSVTSAQPVRAVGRWVALPGLLAVGLSTGHLLPAFDFLPRTDRGGRVPWESVQNASMPVAQLWNLLLPRLFGDETLTFAQQPNWIPRGGKSGLAFVERSFYPGVAVLVLAAAALPLLRAGRAPEARRQLALFSAVLTLFAFLWALGTPAYWPLWRLAPGFGSMTAVARIVCVAAWSLACLAALGVEVLTTAHSEERRGAFRALGIGAAVCSGLALVGHFLYGGWDPNGFGPTLAQSGRPTLEEIAGRNLGLALLWAVGPFVLAALALPWGARPAVLKPALAAGLLAAVVTADLFAFGFGFNPAADPKYVRATVAELDALKNQPEPYRMVSVGPPGQEMTLQQRMPSNLPSTYNLADLHGSDSFVTLRYRQWEAAAKEASGGATHFSRFGAPLLRAAGVRFYLTGSREVAPGLRPVTGPELQEDPRALPYARVHTHVQTPGSQQELLRALALPNREPAVALTSGADAPTYSGRATVFPFQAKRVNGNRLVLEGETPEPGLLVVSEQLDPGWRATVDGVPGPIVAADHLLVGIPLTAGRHRVELTFAPDVFRAGLFVTLAALALCTTLAIAGRPRVVRW